MILEGQEEGDSCPAISVMPPTAVVMSTRLLSRPLTGTPEEEEEVALLSFQHSPLTLLFHIVYEIYGESTALYSLP